MTEPRTNHQNPEPIAPIIDRVMADILSRQTRPPKPAPPPTEVVR